jgi:predicted RNA-binding Zn-ribbon protein involved in translation (DUF1610 family)
LSNFISTTPLDQDVKTNFSPAQVDLLQLHHAVFVKNDDEAPDIKAEDNDESDASMQQEELVQPPKVASWTNNQDECEEKLFVCRFCKKAFAEANLFNQHVQNMHLKYGDKSYLDHSKFHNAGVKHECPHCGMFFTTDSTCKSHILKYHKDEEILNLELKTNAADGPFVCAHCDQKFNRKSHIRRHILHSHSSTNAHIIDRNKNYCKICNKEFHSKLTLHRHAVYHNMAKNATKPELSNSLSAKKFICAHCHSNFTTKRSMRNHILYFHADPNTRLEKPKKTCNVCDMNFARKKLLERHMKVHLKKKIVERINKPKLCMICNKWFSTNYTLKRHLYKDHAQERAYYLCPLCGKRYIFKLLILDFFFNHFLFLRQVFRKKLFEVASGMPQCRTKDI